MERKEEKKKHLCNSCSLVRTKKDSGILIRAFGRFMEIKRSFFNLKDRRRNSCVNQSSSRYVENTRTSSLTDQSQLNELSRMDSPITVVLV